MCEWITYVDCGMALQLLYCWHYSLSMCLWTLFSVAFFASSSLNLCAYYIFHIFYLAFRLNFIAEANNKTNRNKIYIRAIQNDLQIYYWFQFFFLSFFSLVVVLVSNSFLCHSFFLPIQKSSISIMHFNREPSILLKIELTK